MKLSELIAAGSIDDGYELVPVEWIRAPEQKDADGNTTREADIVTFDVLVKREMSGADYEHIYLGAGRKHDEAGRLLDEEDDGIMARRVHRMCKWPAEKPGESPQSIPEDVARRFKSGLLFALCAALRSVEAPLPTSDDIKKN